MAKVIEFDSWGAMLEYVRQTPPPNARETESTSSNSSWCGTPNYDAALNLGIQGWENKAKLAKSFSDALIGKVSSMIEVPTLQFDYEGIDFDIDRVNRGEPESFYYFDKRIEESAGDVTRIVVNGFVSAGISEETIVKRGAVITALVELLEYAGRKVSVTLQTPYNDTIHFKTLVKAPNQPLDLARLMFATGHPSMFRRLMFRALELNPSEHRQVSNYGSPFDLDNKDRGDIYFGNTSYYEKAIWEQNPEAFIIQQLKAQGIDIKTN